MQSRLILENNDIYEELLGIMSVPGYLQDNVSLPLLRVLLLKAMAETDRIA